MKSLLIAFCVALAPAAALADPQLLPKEPGQSVFVYPEVRHYEATLVFAVRHAVNRGFYGSDGDYPALYLLNEGLTPEGDALLLSIYVGERPEHALVVDMKTPRYDGNSWDGPTHEIGVDFRVPLADVLGPSLEDFLSGRVTLRFAAAGGATDVGVHQVARLLVRSVYFGSTRYNLSAPDGGPINAILCRTALGD